MTHWLVEAGLDAVGHVDIAPPDASDKEGSGLGLALVRSIAQAPSGARLNIEVSDGRIAARVDGASP